MQDAACVGLSTGRAESRHSLRVRADHAETTEADVQTIPKLRMSLSHCNTVDVESTCYSLVELRRMSGSLATFVKLMISERWTASLRQI